MEQELTNPKLPILGDAKMIFVDVHDFANIFNMKQEVEKMLIYEDDAEHDTNF